MDPERLRLIETDKRERHWRRWGPYLSDRAWGTVREDYSETGTAWDYFPFEHAHLRAYRWSEDGLLGLCDNHQRLCFGLALWNHQDPILKERLYGLGGPQGNHSEDVKELYYYLDSTPTHSYMKALYKYPQAAFPYQHLREVNQQRSRHEREYELLDTGIFDENRYFDVQIEYAKADIDDIVIEITATNRGPDPAPLTILPQLWFRNTWTWGRSHSPKPVLYRINDRTIACKHQDLGHYVFTFADPTQLLFTENNGDNERLWGSPNAGYVKSAFHRYLLERQTNAVNPALSGTKAAGLFSFTLAPGESRTVSARLTGLKDDADLPPAIYPDEVLADRRAEADRFYKGVHSVPLSEDGNRIFRQAMAGLLWTKQFYHFVIEDWLQGDPNTPPPPERRKHGRNAEWSHLFNDDIISMPDKWEYPWYAAWDSAFHMIPMAMIDPGFAKSQLKLFLREWYMHPNGQIPAYEWAFGDVNPTVHALAVHRVFQIDARLTGHRDYAFLERCFHKLLMNFTWWVNRKDTTGNNVFEGGFLGLDNIGVFDRSSPLPTGGTIEQSDGTSWMAMYCLNMLTIALDLAEHNRAYEDIASKFFEHFLYIASAMNKPGAESLWDEQDGFYYDLLRIPHRDPFRMRIRSMVGIIPLFAVTTIDATQIANLHGFRHRMQWFMRHRPDLCHNIASLFDRGQHERVLLSVVTPDKLRRILRRLVDPNEFLSDFGIRALSKFHKDSPFELHVNQDVYRVSYEPAESTTFLFGGNSNWRGPIWFPVNYLLIESLQKFHFYFGDNFTVDYPLGTGDRVNLWELAQALSHRLTKLFTRDAQGHRPAFGPYHKHQTDPEFKDHLLFFEYFNGDTGEGLGASHQTGWTALIAKLIAQNGE
ncbi:MAG: MGH1-like glycoside hydrolase domain-containing protein [Acidobacteriota bacterium]